MSSDSPPRNDPVAPLIPLLDRISGLLGDRAAPVQAEVHLALDRVRLVCNENENALDDLVQLHREVAASLMAAREEIDALPFVVLNCDEQLIVSPGNQAARDFLGPMQQDQSRHLRDIVAPNDLSGLLNVFAQVEPGQPLNIPVLRMTHANGRNVSVVAHVSVPRDRPSLRRMTIGWPLSLDESIQNIALLERLLDDSDEMISVMGPQGQLLYANWAWAESHGVSKQNIEGRNRLDLMTLHEALRDERLDRRVLREGVSLTTTETRATADGAFGSAAAEAVVQYRMRKFLVHDDLGNAIGVASRSRDVTAETTDMERLRLNALVVEHSLDAIIVMDEGMRIVHVNPAFQSMTGFGPGRVLGKTMDSLLSTDRGRGARREMLAHLQDQGHWRGELVTRKSSGEELTVWCSASRLTDDAGNVIGYFAIESDLTSLRQIQAENERLAKFDQLTGLPNRLRMFERLEDMLQLAQQRSASFAVIFLDLDAFKSVNDTLGHAVGDALLVQIAHRINGTLRNNDLAARIGGDEFVVILPGLGVESASKVAKRLLAELEQPFDLPGFPEYRPAASVGLALYPDHGKTAAELLRNADTAMYSAKSDRTRMAVYCASMGHEAAKTLDLRNALLIAIERQELMLYFQPLFNLTDQQVIGAEALLRWNRPGLGVVQPNDFLPFAKAAGLMPVIDGWVMSHAISLLGRWHATSMLPPGWVLSINQSVDNLNSPDWQKVLADLMTNAGLLHPAHLSALQIELTEGQVSGPMDTAVRNLRGLKELGVRLAVDDFGTGHSNLSYLRTLPISTLKIDAGFISGIETDSNQQVLVDAMLSLGTKLGYEVLAEGIETESQRRTLLKMGCKLGQGYLVSAALPEGDFASRFLTIKAGVAPPKLRIH